MTMVMVGLLSGCHWINEKLGIPDDNLAEEIVESQLERASGVDIDLTPDSPEH